MLAHTQLTRLAAFSYFVTLLNYALALAFLMYFSNLHQTLHVLAPLICKLRKGQPRVYTKVPTEQLDALHMLQRKLTSLLVQILPRLKGSYTLGTDSCDRQIRCRHRPKQPDRYGNPNGYWPTRKTDGKVV